MIAFLRNGGSRFPGSNDTAEAIRATREIAKMAEINNPTEGVCYKILFGVARRGLQGLLEEADKAELGDRLVPVSLFACFLRVQMTGVLQASDFFSISTTGRMAMA